MNATVPRATTEPVENPGPSHPAMDGADALFDLAPTVKRWATIDADGCYRYVLGRDWSPNRDARRFATFVMLNPSTADADYDDPTIRRCIGFAKALGCDGLLVGNLYAYRATKPADLWRAAEPTGGDRNDDMLQELILRAVAVKSPLIAAWGANARPDLVATVMAMRGAHAFMALGNTRDGSPRHPLYLSKTAQPQPWPTGRPA
jgi:hypothetical protein